MWQQRHSLSVCIWFQDFANLRFESTVRVFPRPPRSLNNYFSISVQILLPNGPSIFLSARFTEQFGRVPEPSPGLPKRGSRSQRIFGDSSVTLAQWWRARHFRNLVICRSQVRFRPKTSQLRFTWIWANKPSGKGSKLLFPVIKAIYIKIRDCAASCNNYVQRCTKVNAIDVTAKTFFERLYLVLGLAPICALSQLSVCSHTPTVHSTTVSRFPCKFFPPDWPLNFLLARFTK